MRMDSEPPLPVFPRDYPDTPSGQSYWDGGSSEWQLVRSCLEQGWGRVKIGKAKQQIVDDELSLPVLCHGATYLHYQRTHQVVGQLQWLFVESLGGRLEMFSLDAVTYPCK